MCAFEKGRESVSASDERVISRTRESLASLLQPDNAGTEAASVAIDTLISLKTRLASIRRKRADLLAETEKNSTVLASAKSHHERLDRDIIEAKMEVGELLSARDGVARDLARAKRTLSEFEDSGNGGRNGGSADSIDGIGSDVSVVTSSVGSIEERTKQLKLSAQEILAEDDLEKLFDIITEDKLRLKIAEKELVRAVDKINSVTKRRSELQKKLKVAQEEWES